MFLNTDLFVANVKRTVGHLEKPPLYFENSRDLRILSEFFVCARLNLTVFRGPLDILYFRS